MHLSFLPILTIPTLSLSLTSTSTSTNTNTLNITVLNAENNHSTLECWALTPGFETSSQHGTAGTESLNLGPIGGGASNASFSVLPAGFDGGRHHAPVMQWVLFLSGLAHITLPNSTASAWIRGGKHGAILALDTADVSALGHYTVYPSKEQTVAMQIPLGEGGVPGHAVLHGGACWGEEVRGEV